MQGRPGGGRGPGVEVGRSQAFGEADALPASGEEMLKFVEKLEKQMRDAARAFEFEKAAEIRDRIKVILERLWRTGEMYLEKPDVLTELDYAREGLNEGFKFNNPNVKDSCGCGESFNI